MYTVDIADEGDAVPKYKKATSNQYKFMQGSSIPLKRMT